MWSTLKKRFASQPGSVLGIDIGTGGIKLAEVSFSPSGPVLQCCGLVELEQPALDDGRIVDRAAVADALRKVLSASGTPGRKAVVAASGRALFVREIVMPVMNNAELREAIKWDLEQYVPYNADNCYFDFAVLGKGHTENELRIMLVIVPNGQIDELVSVLREVGITPVAVEIEPLALYRTLIMEGNSMVVDIGARHSQLVMYKEGVPVITRVIPLGGSRFTETVMNVLELERSEAERLKRRQEGLLHRVDTADDSLPLHRQLHFLAAELAREVRRTAEYYQSQNRGASIERLVLTGGGANLSNLPEHLTDLLGAEVVMHDPLSGLTVAPSFDQQFVRKLAPQLAVAIGLSLRGGEA